jgi:lysophospholipase
MLATLIIGLVSAVSEVNYVSNYKTLVEPFWATGVSSSFTGLSGLKITYWAKVVKGSSKALIISPGYSNQKKYFAELAYDLQDHFTSIYIIDHRGQGNSGRMLKDSEKLYVNDFNDYATDLKTFFDVVVAPNGHATKYLLGHSMGGAIASLFVHKNPTYVSKMVLTAPMMQPNTGKFGPVMIQVLNAATWVTTTGDNYAPGEGPWKLYPWNNSSMTGSKLRYDQKDADIIANPAAKIGGAVS